MTIVLDSHMRIRTGEESPTLITKCNVSVQDVYSVEDEDLPSCQEGDAK